MSNPGTKKKEKPTAAKAKALKKFIKLMDQFLQGMKVVFPQCLQIKKLCLKFEIAMGVPVDKTPNPRIRLIELWHKSMHPFYERCALHDESVWQELCANPDSYVAKLDLWTKWNSKNMTAQNKNTIWNYIVPMNKLSNKYENGDKDAVATAKAPVADAPALLGSFGEIMKDTLQRLEKNPPNTNNLQAYMQKVIVECQKSTGNDQLNTLLKHMSQNKTFIQNLTQVTQTMMNCGLSSTEASPSNGPSSTNSS